VSAQPAPWRFGRTRRWPVNGPQPLQNLSTRRRVALPGLGHSGTDAPLQRSLPGHRLIASNLAVPPHSRCWLAPPEGLNDRRPESFSSLYLPIADGVSVESEVRRGTSATGILLERF
jgi:hypothetical protein